MRVEKILRFERTSVWEMVILFNLHIFFANSL